MGPLARRLGLLLLGLLALAACAPRPLPPEARYLGAEIRGLELSPEPALLLAVRVAFKNPNPFPLPLATFGTRLRVGEVRVPLDLTLPPGKPRPPSRAPHPEGGPGHRPGPPLPGRGGGGPGGPNLEPRPHLLQGPPRLPLEPLRVRRAGVNLFLENPNPLPLRAEGTLVLLGQRLLVRADLPAKGRRGCRWWA